MEQNQLTETKRKPSAVLWMIWVVLLIGILLAGAYFRYAGLDWDQHYQLHPDERFIGFVLSSIHPVANLGEYFDTEHSTLNPNNVGYSFYVYGTLPIFMVRYAAGWFGMETDLLGFGRLLSATLDMGTVILVFFIALRLFGKPRLALLATAFAAFSVLPIQLSHFNTTDTYANFFIYLAIYFAVRAMTAESAAKRLGELAEADGLTPSESGELRRSTLGEWTIATLKMSAPYILFGIGLGLAAASKISAFPLAAWLPGAALVVYAGLKQKQRRLTWAPLLALLVLGALVAIITFRIFQPYAFKGPGFLGIGINEQFVNNLGSLAQQMSGTGDSPPELQWARRPITFAWTNMVTWGLGLPLGLLAWGGFVWMGWKILKGEWRKYLLLWGWTGAFFVWQSIGFTRSMRYQLPVYPSLAIIAAWAVFALWEHRANVQTFLGRMRWNKILAAVVGVGVLVGTFTWAFAFTRIYNRENTRLAASDWIYQNVPAPINVRMETARGIYNHPVGYTQGASATQEEPMVIAYQPRLSGELTGIEFAHVRTFENDAGPTALFVSVSAQRDGSNPLAIGMVVDDFYDTSGNDERGRAFRVILGSPKEGDPLPILESDKTYYFAIQCGGPAQLLKFAGPMLISLQTEEGETFLPLPEPAYTITAGMNFTNNFSANYSGTLTEVFIPHILDREAAPGLKTLRLTISRDIAEMEPLGVVEISSEFLAGSDIRGEGYTFRFETPFEVNAHATYTIKIEQIAGEGAIAVYGSRHTFETTWDDPLPYGMNGFSPFDYQNGLYRSDFNFEMYWDDNADKLKRIQTILDQTDYIFSSSNRSWGTTIRVPERYPLTTLFYRELLGCPPEKDLFWCYAVAEPGMFTGSLGFDLVYVNQSDPNLGNIRFNSQFAEEAFTVYDAPKVMIFQKRADYDPDKVAAILKQVDLDKVKRLTPMEASNYKGFLLLPLDRLMQQRAGGTWSELFPRNLFYNQSQVMGLIVWYLAISLIGWAVYPFTRMALGGLRDKGYPFARLVGIVLLTFVVWIGGSFGIPFERGTIILFFLFLLAVNAFIFYRQRKTILKEFRENKRYFLIVEGLTLALFLFFLLVRLGNPDLWHPWKGGEKPMDFSYFNAVLKSTTFPPYDPWFAGGYLNYYYYGFLLAGVPTKLLGIIPSVAYNLVLPTFFAFLGTGAFSVVWNFLDTRKRRKVEPAPDELPLHLPSGPESGALEEEEDPPLHKRRLPLLGGLAGTVGLLLLGNWGTVRMLWHGMQILAAPGGTIEGADIFSRLAWTFQGFGKLLSGAGMPYSVQDYYWIPSRAIPGNSITEFPYFTFLYADPHAHLFALPLTILALAVALAVLKGMWKWGEEGGFRPWVSAAATFALAALAIGALRVTNTWDMPTFLVLGVLVFGYTAFRYASLSDKFLNQSELVLKGITSLAAGLGMIAVSVLLGWERSWVLYVVSAFIAIVVFGLLVEFKISGTMLRRLIYTGLVVVALAALTFLFYQPYAQWNEQAYNTIETWNERTPFWSYLTHWGVFLFVIVSWLVWETRDWLVRTPISGLNGLRRNIILLYVIGVLLLAGTITLLLLKVEIALIVAPLGIWVVILMLRPGQTDAKRLVLFMTGSALALTLFVEVLRIGGDIGRMNTVFKFYLQAWTLFALSAGAALLWLFPAVRAEWKKGWRIGWSIFFYILIGGAALTTLVMTGTKVADRMTTVAPHTLDGMEYMRWAEYNDHDVNMDLSQDFSAIQWMQDNVKGSPVILEGYDGEYHWGARFTIYTGLPDVLGWRWHQSQQRVEFDPWVWARMEEINNAYETENITEITAFLKKYDVRYIVVGQLERAKYLTGLGKFQEWNGKLWNEVFREADTVIYEVVK